MSAMLRSRPATTGAGTCRKGQPTRRPPGRTSSGIWERMDDAAHGYERFSLANMNDQNRRPGFLESAHRTSDDCGDNRGVVCVDGCYTFCEIFRKESQWLKSKAMPTRPRRCRSIAINKMPLSAELQSCGLRGWLATRRYHLSKPKRSQTHGR